MKKLVEMSENSRCTLIPNQRQNVTSFYFISMALCGVPIFILGKNQIKTRDENWILEEILKQ